MTVGLVSHNAPRPRSTIRLRSRWRTTEMANTPMELFVSKSAHVSCIRVYFFPSEVHFQSCIVKTLRNHCKVCQWYSQVNYEITIIIQLIFFNRNNLSCSKLFWVALLSADILITPLALEPRLCAKYYGLYVQNFSFQLTCMRARCQIQSTFSHCLSLDKVSFPFPFKYKWKLSFIFDLFLKFSCVVWLCHPNQAHFCHRENNIKCDSQLEWLLIVQS